MEGVPVPSMIRFPLKRSACPPNFKQKLSTFICENYNENVDSFSHDIEKTIEELESLRARSVDLLYDLGECSTLKKYFCQLNSLKNKFPLGPNSPSAIEFMWYGINSQSHDDFSDIDFEMCTILYNIGANHTQLGAFNSCSTQTSEEIKISCIHFECAAWAFQYLRHNFSKFFTQDISPDLLSIFKNICLAQAQEGVLQIISFIPNQDFNGEFTVNIALQVVEFFQLSLMTCDHVLSNNCGGGWQYSYEIIQAVEKWKKQIEVKVLYYTAVAFLYQGLKFDASFKLLECIGVYRVSMQKLDEAIKLDNSVEKTDSIHNSLAFTRNVLTERLSKAERSNPSANSIPNMDSILNDIKRESLVKGISFEFDDPAVAGRIFFNRLEPVDSHKLKSHISMEKIKILREHSTQIERKNEALDKFFLQLQLKQFDSCFNGIPLPQELLDCCTALSSKQDDVIKLSNLVNAFSSKTSDVEKNISEVLLCIELLQLEQSGNIKYSENMSDSLIIAQLSVEAKKCNETVIQALNSDKPFFTEMKTMSSNLNILIKPMNEILNYIPSVPLIEPKDRSGIYELKNLSNQLVEIREERESLEIQLRRSIYADNFLTRPHSPESNVGNVIQMLKTHTQKLDANLKSQDDLTKDMTEINETLSNARKAISSCSEKRKKLIRSFLNAFQTYPASIIKLEDCVQFYETLRLEINVLLNRARNVEDEKEKKIQKAIQEARNEATTNGITTMSTSASSNDWSSANANNSATTTSANTYGFQSVFSQPNQSSTTFTAQPYVARNMATNTGFSASSTIQIGPTPNYKQHHSTAYYQTFGAPQSYHSNSLPTTLPAVTGTGTGTSTFAPQQGLNLTNPQTNQSHQIIQLQPKPPQQHVASTNQWQTRQTVLTTSFQPLVFPTLTSSFGNTNTYGNANTFGSTSQFTNPNAGATYVIASQQPWNLSATSSSSTAMDTTPQVPSIATVKPYTTKATAAAPPNWEESLDEAIQALTPFHKIKISPNSDEYRVIFDLVSSAVEPVSLERVVNTALWKKFVSQRRDLLVTKSDDLELLKELGVSGKEIHHRAHAAFNYDKSPSVLPYSDNVALLFHCTRGNVDAVLSQGLDERLDNSTGLLGRGIYFADDPNKSISYYSNGILMIFAVFLGDCYSVDHLSNRNTFVREPEKTKEQKRSPTDLFFDSIVGRPNNAAANEYVIYNRFQCCPMYVCTYNKGKARPQPTKNTKTDFYTQIRSKIPPFAWAKTSTKKHNQNQSNWPFYAQLIFDRMTNDPNAAGLPEEPIIAESEDTVLKLSSIAEFGFTDDKADFLLVNASTSPIGMDKNTNTKSSNIVIASGSTSVSVSNRPRKTSDMNDMDKYDKVFAAVLNPPPDPNTTFAAEMQNKGRKNRKRNTTVKVTNIDPSSNLNPPIPMVINTNGPSAAAGTGTQGNEDCLICCVCVCLIPSSPQHWQVLKCNHKLCFSCFGKITTNGTTMSGQNHTFTKCPFCQTCSGVEIGTCPTGTMRLNNIQESLPGYEQYRTLQINYNIAQGKYKLNITAYLPNSEKGIRVYKLLCIAWDRRLCFTIGTSMTTGQQDCLVWNINHKTAVAGGVQSQGYPDEIYLDRVLDELKQYNIE